MSASTSSGSQLLLFFNGSVYTGANDGQPSQQQASLKGQALLCDSSTGRILAVGDEKDVRGRAARLAVEEIDLQGRFLMPAFLDSHVHVSLQGVSLEKVDLDGCKSLEEVQQRLKDGIAEAQSKEPVGGIVKRIQAKRFVPSMLGEGRGMRKEYLDAVSEGGKVAIYVEARDLHSSWLSSAALSELSLTPTSPCPPGGSIDASVSGVLEEAAHFEYVWALVPKLYTEAERTATLLRAMDHFLAQGVTTVVDMAMDEDNLRLLRVIYKERGGSLPIRVVCHWLVQPTGDTEKDCAQVKRAKQLQAELEEQGCTEWLRVTGIKIIGDGVIDSCTAALHQPYANGRTTGPIWPLSHLAPVCILADSLDLQLAIHAIGDLAVDNALDGIEAAVQANGPRAEGHRRHRIEHLELTRAASVPRLAALGVTASVQPVHACPSVQGNWRAVLGGEEDEHQRCGRAYAYADFLRAGVRLALGTDAPTTAYTALENLYVAQTRRAPRDSSLPPTTPEWAIPLLAAVHGSTLGGTYACKAEGSLGKLEAGMYADLAILDVDVVAQGGGQSLVTARVEETWVAGKRAWNRA